MPLRSSTTLALLLALLLAATPAHADHPNGAALVRSLGPQASAAFSVSTGPAAGKFGALVAIPSGAKASDLGLVEVAPGIGRIQGGSPAILSFAGAHPGVPLEVAPPLHMLLDRAGVSTRAVMARADYGVDGSGVLVGVADTGLDVAHADFRDENGHTRVAWMLDLSLAPVGKHPELEQQFGLRDEQGNVVAGAVFSAEDIDAMIASGTVPVKDEVGHGSHVTSIAGGNGGFAPHTDFVGMAPKATILFARVTPPGSESVSNDALVSGVGFLYDRADALGKPVVVNLSLGGDFGPHDGTMMWEQVLASHVGPDKPGRALVVAAGNSGSIVETPVHQSVHVTDGDMVRVPIQTHGASRGGVQVWVSMRDGASLKVGLQSPDSEWISPVDEGDERGKDGSSYNAGVINGSSAADSPVPQGSHGAVVLWQGSWPAGIYNVTLDGHGTADLFMQATGDADSSILGETGFVGAVREGTINLPGTHPSIIAVGCTVNRARWVSIDQGDVTLRVPILDGPGGFATRQTREIADGEVCWFSSAGPTVTGVPKPEIAAPGALVVAAMSQQALPGTAGSMFTDSSCPPLKGSTESDPKCLQVDATHAIALGTSMSAPMVSGAVALLLQKDPSLTQDKILALLQAGAHRFRGDAPFDDQSSPGELDVAGSLDALDQMKTPALVLPSAATSWLTLSAEYAAADGSTPLTAIVELRTADGAHRADLFDPGRLQPRVTIDGVPQRTKAFARRGPGVWTTSVDVPTGFGGSTMTIGATFDGVDVVQAKTIPIATDAWTARYPPTTKGGCATSGGAAGQPLGAWGLVLGLAGVAWRRKRPLAP